MANEIYNTSWWGNAIDTAITAGTEPDFFGSQMKMLTSQQPELVVNGDFATDSDWIKGTGWTISGGKANFIGSAFGPGIRQINITTFNKVYAFSCDIISGSFDVKVGSMSYFAYSGGAIYVTANNGSDTSVTIRPKSSSVTIDNVSVKLVRAEEVEAVKCLADWIHTTALQDLNN